MIDDSLCLVDPQPRSSDIEPSRNASDLAEVHRFGHMGLPEVWQVDAASDWPASCWSIPLGAFPDGALQKTKNRFMSKELESFPG